MTSDKEFPEMEAEPSVMARSIDLTRKIVRFCLAVFLWSHALFLLNVQSRILEYLNARLQVTTAEAILLVLLLTFSFVAGSGVWQTIVNLFYIYFFPFVLLFYAIYWPIRILRLSFPSVKMARSPDIPANALQVRLTSDSVVLTAPISERKSEIKSKSAAAFELLTRPFRKFTFLWCLLVLLASHKSMVWIALTVLLLQLVAKIYWTVRLFWSSKSFLARAATSVSTFLSDTINKVTNLNFEVTPLTELKNLWNQIKGFKIVLEFVSKSTFFARLAFGIGLVSLICAHLYFAAIFSFVYVGAAKVAGLTLTWPDSLTTSLFILAYVGDLPKTLMLRVLGGIHFMLFLTLGAGTVVSYFRRQLEPLRSAFVSMNMRLSEDGLQDKLIILQTKVQTADQEQKV
jgi:hypothetical protein